MKDYTPKFGMQHWSWRTPDRGHTIDGGVDHWTHHHVLVSTRDAEKMSNHHFCQVYSHVVLVRKRGSERRDSGQGYLISVDR